MNDDENAFTYVVGICILLTLIAFMLFPVWAHAKDIATFESRGDRVTLTDQPCTSTVRNNIKPEWRDKFKAATYYVGQKRQTVQGFICCTGTTIRQSGRTGICSPCPCPCSNRSGFSLPR